MAVPECNLDTRTRENNENKAKMAKIKEKRALLEYQEINLAKTLAGNNKKLRDKALKGLKKWMENRSQALRVYLLLSPHVDLLNNFTYFSIQRRGFHENLERIILFNVDVR